MITQELNFLSGHHHRPALLVGSLPTRPPAHPRLFKVTGLIYSSFLLLFPGFLTQRPPLTLTPASTHRWPSSLSFILFVFALFFQFPHLEGILRVLRLRMPRPNKVTSSRSTPRPSTRSQQQSPSINKPSLLVTLKNPSNAAPSSRGEASDDNDNDSVCSSSKSSDALLARSSAAKSKPKDDTGVVKAPWRHPDELDYLRPYDWSEDRIITQLRSVVFTVPPPVFGKQPFIEITLYEGGDFDKPKPVKVPRGYRVPLMFVAKFQWASLKLVLTSAQREKEWSDYKFDILHLSRLCQHFFSGASAACDIAVVDVPPVKTRAPGSQLAGAMSRKWRCPTFDRALARYNKNWLISREEFLRDFYIEFEDEEYVKDVLKIGTSRLILSSSPIKLA